MLLHFLMLPSMLAAETSTVTGLAERVGKPQTDSFFRAESGVQILGAPLLPPESLLRKFDALRLPVDAGSGVVRYAARQDAELLRQWLRSVGYLDASVETQLSQGKPVWQVSAGELWHVRQVRIEPAPLQTLSLIRQGDVFRSEDYESSKSKLLWSWRDAGYLRAEYAEAIVRPDHASHQVDMVWRLQLGPLFHISDIRVEGARQYDAYLAVKLSRLQVGQVLSQLRLQAAMRYVSDDSRYQNAIVVPEIEEAKGDQMPVRITVTEAPWRKLTGDVGYASDSGLTVAAGWVDRSIFGGRMETRLRAQLSPSNSGVGATLLRPVWPTANQQVGVSLDYNRVASDGRRYSAISGGPFWQWNFHSDDYLRLSLHGERVNETGTRVVTLGPRADLHFVRTDGGFLPARGWRGDIGLDFPMRMGSQGLWPLLDLSGRLYYQPLPWLLASPRVGYGRTLNMQGRVPKTYRQFAGGAASVRGYALDSLGPIGIDGLATGGLMKTYGGLDLVLMPGAEWVSPVFFSDVGKVWQTIGMPAPIAWSIGAGIIVHTPAGPLRIDLSLPQKRRPQDSGFQIYISLGEVL